MKKNFTQLIAKSNNLKRYSVATTIALLLLVVGGIWANIVPITPQNISVSADKAIGGPAADFTSLNPVVIDEGDQKDFNTGNGTFTITAPSGWAFKPSGVNIKSEVINSTQTSNISITGISYNSNTTPTIITGTFTVNAQNRLDRVTISGLALQAQTGAVMPASAVTLSISGVSVAGFSSPTTIANISQTYGAPAQLAIGTQPLGTETYAPISSKILVKDWAGNAVLNANNSITVAIDTNPSGGVLSGTKTVAAANGEATFSDLSIDAAGEGYTLIASSGSLTSVVSNSFTISSKTPTLDAITACITEGAGETILTLTGTNFEKNSVGRVNGNNRTTTFVSSTQLKVTLPASDLAATGDLSISVLNPGPPADNISNVQALNIKPSFNNATIAGERVVCAGQSIQFEAPTGFMEYSWSTSFGEGVIVATANPAVVNFEPAASAFGVATVTVSAKNGCGEAGQVSFNVDVQPTPQAAISYTGSTEICAGESKVLSATEAPEGDVYTYQWFNGTSAVGANFPTLTVTEAGSYSVTITGSNNCSSTSSPVNISVNPLPVATINADGPTTFCDGGSVKLTASDGASWLWSNGATTQSITVTATETFTVKVTDSKGCTSEASDPVDVTVNPLPVATIQAGGPTTFCQGGAVTLTAQGGTSWLWSNGEITQSISVSTSGTFTVKVTDDNSCTSLDSEAVTVTVNPLPEVTADNKRVCFGENTVALTGSPAGGTWSGTGVSGSTFSASGLAAGDYTVTYSYTDGNGCSNSATATVTVDPLPSVSITPTGPLEFCEGKSVVLVASSAPSGDTYTYEWFKVGTTGSIYGDKDYVATTSGDYYVSVTNKNNCQQTSETLTVIVAEEPEEAVITVVGSTTFCLGGSVSLNANLAPPGQEYTYRWLKNSVEIDGEIEASYVVKESGDYQVIVNNKVEDCDKTSVAVTVTVLPQPTAAITSGNQQLCIGANNATTFTVTGDFSGGTAQWLSSNSNFVVSDAVYNTSTGKATATVTAAGTGSSTITLRTTNSASNCTTANSSVTLTVNPLPETTIIAESATTFCEGGSVVLSAPEGTYSYQWLSNGSAITTAGGTDRQYTATTAGDYTVRVTNTTTGCVATTATATTVTVNPQPSVSSAAASPSSKCVGEGNTTVFDLTGSVANGDPGWSVVSATGDAVVTNISSPNTVNTQVTVAGIGSVTMRLTSSSSVASCNDASKDVTITVNPYPVADAGPDQALCAGATYTRFFRDGSGTGDESKLEVKWTVKSTDPGVEVTNLAYPWLYDSFVDITGVGRAVLTMTITTNKCTTSDDVVFTVKPMPTVAEVENKTYCNGDAGAAISFSSSVEGATFSWTSSREIGFGTSGDGDIPAFTATNTGTSPVTATINVRATVDGCTGPQQSFKITVNPSPKLSSTLTPAAICSGTEFTYNPTSATDGATFSWTRAEVPGISNSAATGSGAVSEILINATTAPIKVTYVYTTSANNCSGQPQNVEVIVNPIPILSSTLSPAAICSGTTFSYNPESATAGATFSWTRIAIAGINNGDGANGTGAVKQILTNSTTDPIDVVYRFTTTANKCSGPEQDVVVRVNPTPVLSNMPANVAICSGDTFSYTPKSLTQNASFAWSRSGVTGINGGAGATGNGDINEKLTNSTANPIDVTYSVVTSANNCNGPAQNIVVRVNPTPILSSTLSPAAVCSETAFTYNPTSATTGTSFTWTRAYVEGISNAAVTTPQSGSVNETLINSTSTDKTVTYAYTLTANGCSNIQNVSVVVKPKPQPSFTGVTDGQILYSGDGNVTLEGSHANGTFTGVGVTGNTFSPCDAFKTITDGSTSILVPITYTVEVNGCKNSITKNVTVKKSTYTVVVTAKPMPFCKGDNVTYTTYVYRDITKITYPYLVDALGRPVYEDGSLVPAGSGNLPVANDKPVSEGGYPFPEGTPEIIKKMGYRFFEPIVEGGVRVDPALFDYQWHKNEKNERKNDGVITTDAGLSSMDYYGVYVTSKTSNTCLPTLNSQISDRKYSAELESYTSTLTANPICKEGKITFTVTLNSDFPYWSIAGLTIDLVRSRGSLVIGSATYNGTNSYSFEINVPPTDLVNGDEVYVRFNSIIDEYRKGSKCAGRPSSNIIKVKIDQPVTLTTDLSADPQNKCEGETVSFTANATGTDLQFVWYKEGSIDPLPIGGNISVSNTSSSSTLTIANIVEANEGKYYVVISNSATSACSTTVQSGSASLVVNPLPLARTVIGGPYCPLTEENGAEIILENSESGVTYNLSKDGALLATRTGDGGTISFGTYKEGEYTVSATSASSCANANVGTTTVTATSYPTTITGDLQITWINNMTQWEVIAFSDHLDYLSEAEMAGFTYEWFAGSSEETAVPIDTTDYPNNKIIIDNPTTGMFVRCVIKAPNGMCIPDVMMDNTDLVPLPVEIIYLTAQKQGNEVVLEWATAMEKDNAGFEVQVSQDGHTYRKLDFVATKNGNSSQKQVYKYVDKENGKYGTRYYRLKQTDENGQFEFFGPKVVEFGSMTDKIVVYPNPFDNKIELNIEAEQDGTMEIVLSNSIGKQLIQKTVMVEKGLNTEQLLLEMNLPQGVYFITTRMGSTTNHFKLLKR